MHVRIAFVANNDDREVGGEEEENEEAARADFVLQICSVDVQNARGEAHGGKRHHHEFEKTLFLVILCKKNKVAVFTCFFKVCIPLVIKERQAFRFIFA